MILQWVFGFINETSKIIMYPIVFKSRLGIGTANSFGNMGFGIHNFESNQVEIRQANNEPCFFSFIVIGI